MAMPGLAWRGQAGRGEAWSGTATQGKGLPDRDGGQDERLCELGTPSGTSPQG